VSHAAHHEHALDFHIPLAPSFPANQTQATAHTLDGDGAPSAGATWEYHLAAAAVDHIPQCARIRVAATAPPSSARTAVATDPEH